MTAELFIAPEAEEDIGDAYAWYERRRHGLGEDFLSSVDASIQRICRIPELNATIFKEYRRVLVRRFPYAIFYEFDGTTVTVFGVFHTSRDSETWHLRLG